jgi:nucleoside triphosphate diphosphatase
MQDDSPLGRAMAMVADLRIRCDWDRAQTRQTLRPYLIEEAHELDAAVASGDPAAIRDEVADLMLHLAWQLVLGGELGEFTPAEIADDLVTKMERRHPHLFGGGEREPWETLKTRERAAEGGVGGGTLDGLPPTLPALLMAWRLQQRAASVGFDWPDCHGPLRKIREECAEVEQVLANRTPDAERLTDEIGDLLFAVVNLARKADVPPGPALEAANAKFRRRFDALEALARRRGIPLAIAGLPALDALWDEVKRSEPGGGG